MPNQQMVPGAQPSMQNGMMGGNMPTQGMMGMSGGGMVPVTGAVQVGGNSAVHTTETGNVAVKIKR